MQRLDRATFAALCGPFQELPPSTEPHVYTSGYDLQALLALCRGARGVIEFGTARGQTTLALARYTQAEIRTVDVDESLVPLNKYQRCDLRQRSDVGAVFHGTPEAARITQVWADPNAPYDLDDLAPFGWHCDAAFIDGLHSYEGVRKDTLAAAACILRGPRSGTLIWDDYLSAGVPVVLAKLGAAMSNLIYLEGTRFVICQANETDLRKIEESLQ